MKKKATGPIFKSSGVFKELCVVPWWGVRDVVMSGLVDLGLILRY